MKRNRVKKKKTLDCFYLTSRLAINKDSVALVKEETKKISGKKTERPEASHMDTVN